MRTHSKKTQIKHAVSQQKIINYEITYPTKNEVCSTRYTIPEKLNREKTLKWWIEKIYPFSYKIPQNL
jgi:hypothetical protein